MQLWLGIDVPSRAAHQASLADESGRFLWSGHHFRTGAEDLERLWAMLPERGADTEVLVILEPTRNACRSDRQSETGCVERVLGTILEECWKPSFARHLIPKQTGLRRDLAYYLRYYNTDRAHTGRWTRGRTPESVIGKARLWS